MSRLPTYFLSHGGGPWPWLKDQMGGRFDALEASLVALRHELGGQPRAVLMVTGHWETPDFAVSAAARPGMVYDYYGFPEFTYRITYGAPGQPELAAQVRTLLQGGGLACASDPERGLDHGTFSLMRPIWPEADMPVVQLSVRQDFDPAAHLAAGRLLAPLRDEGVLIVGSGFSYHNLRRMDRSGTLPSRQFDAWLHETLVDSPAPQRAERLLAWESAPSARVAHAREDHLLPLMVAVGAAEQEVGACVYHEDAFMGTIAASSFRFGAAPSGHA